MPNRSGTVVVHVWVITFTTVHEIDPDVAVTSEPAPGVHASHWLMFDSNKKLAPRLGHFANSSAPGVVGAVGIVVEVGVPGPPPQVGRGVTEFATESNAA